MDRRIFDRMDRIMFGQDGRMKTGLTGFFVWGKRRTG